MSDIREQTYKNYTEFVNPGLALLLRISRLDAVEVSARGSVITDDRGKEYIDCAGGYGVFSLGYGHPEIIAAVKKQLELLPLGSKLFLNKPMADLAALLADITPGTLQFSFFVNSGAEAVENAIKLARLATGKKQIISTTGAFHGKTFGALSASGRDMYRKPFEPLVPSFDHIRFGDLDALTQAITEDTAAIILEPIQGEGGIIIPPAGYLKGVRALCDKYDILFIADEVQTGLGRTGKLFGVDHDGVVPDIMTLAKALGGGVMPIGAVIGRKEIWNKWKENPLLITSTFGGNPLACAAAIATIEVIMRDKLWERSHKLGEMLKDKLRLAAGRFPRIVKDIRGRGLLIGVELAEEGLGGVIIPEMVNNGVAVGYTLNMPRVIRFEPPLVIEVNLIDQAVGVFEKALAEADRLFDRMYKNR